MVSNTSFIYLSFINDDHASVLGQNIIVISPGANKKITPKYIKEQGEQFIRRAKVVIVQLEIPIESTQLALELANKYGAISIFNTAPGSSNIPKEMFSVTDILCLNETEVLCL